jgi:AraC-like DNA-binding protein
MAHEQVTTMAEDDAEQYRPGTRQPPKDLCEALSQAIGAGPAEGGRPPRFSVRVLDRLRLGWLGAEELALELRCDLVAPTVAAWIQLAGSAQLRQGERVAEVATGDACLVRSARPLAMRASAGTRVMLVEVPEQQLVDRFKLWRHALLRPVRATSGAPAIFREATQSVWRWSEGLGSGIHDSVASAVIDLMGAMICFAAPVNPDCISRAFYQQERIRKVARMHLRNPELNVELIADAVDLSPRQVHRLFADEQLPLMRWIWVQRLEHCYRELQDTTSPSRSIGDIAYAWGFNDQAHFSRAFRKHFGVTPRQVRMRAAVASDLGSGIP